MDMKFFREYQKKTLERELVENKDSEYSRKFAEIDR